MRKTNIKTVADAEGGPVDLEKLARATEGYTGADMAGICKMAVKISARGWIAKVGLTHLGVAAPECCLAVAHVMYSVPRRLPRFAAFAPFRGFSVGDLWALPRG